MGKVIMITSGKGGTGKTTLAANVGAKLAVGGRLTVLVDLDMGLRNLDIALGMESNVVYDFQDFIEERCSLDDILIHVSGYENLYFIAAPQSLPAVEVNMERLREFWELLRNRFEFCIADSPAGLDGGFVYGAEGADSAVVVTLAETTALRDADRAITMLANKGITDIKLVINRVNPDWIELRAMPNMDECMDMLGIPMLGIVAEDAELPRLSCKGELAINDSNSTAGIAFGNIAARLCGVDVPIMEFNKKSLLKRLREFLRRSK